MSKITTRRMFPGSANALLLTLITSILLLDPGRARARAPARPAAARGAEVTTSQLRRLEQRLDTFKERVHMSRLRLLRLKERVLGEIVAGATVKIRHSFEMGRLFKLIRLSYVLDGVRIKFEHDATGALTDRRKLAVYDQRVKPGVHTLSVHLTLRGASNGLFPYFEGYTFDVRSSRSFTVDPGRQVSVLVRVRQQDDVLTTVENLPRLTFDISNRSLRTMASARR